MRRAGVRDDRPVVVYDDWGGHAAGRVWWPLRHHGHHDVRVLDGGWRPGWPTAGASRPEPSTWRPATSRPRRPDRACPSSTPTGSSTSRCWSTPGPPERYRGEGEPIDAVAGHIPGAVNVPTAANLRADGRFRSPEQLRALYAAAGVTGDTPRWRSTAGPGSPPCTTSSRSSWRGSGRRCTPAAGAPGSPTRSGRWRRADPVADGPRGARAVPNRGHGRPAAGP